MLLLLSPAKSLDEQSVVPPALAALQSMPQFGSDAARLVARLAPRTPDEIGALMHLSPALARLNAERFGAWKRRHTAANSRPAAWMFDGDVYRGLDAHSLSVPQWQWAQQHLLMLSGLYGLLRPLDRMQPYRLEMGTRLANEAGADLYAFWRPRLSKRLNTIARRDGAAAVINLASQEYAGAIDRTALKPPLVDCVFEDWQRGAWRVVGLYAKRARGLMARHAVLQRAATPQAQLGFDAEGYRFAADASSSERLVFRRRQPERAAPMKQ